MIEPNQQSAIENQQFLELDLHSKFDDAVRRDLEERVGSNSVAGNEHEQAFAPERQARTACGQQRLDAEEERGVGKIDHKAPLGRFAQGVGNVRFLHEAVPKRQAKKALTERLDL